MLVKVRLTAPYQFLVKSVSVFGTKGRNEKMTNEELVSSLQKLLRSAGISTATVVGEFVMPGIECGVSIRLKDGTLYQNVLVDHYVVGGVVFSKHDYPEGRETLHLWTKFVPYENIAEIHDSASGE